MNEKEWEDRIDRAMEGVYEHIKSKQFTNLSAREIDVLVDRYVMDNRPSVNIHSKMPTSDYSPPNYSTAIADAWKVVEYLDKEINTRTTVSNNSKVGYEIEMYKYDNESDLEDVYRLHEKELPMAICKCALKCVEIYN